jgi:3D (Asp-Asp-Asp) domain-containing protein
MRYRIPVILWRRNKRRLILLLLTFQAIVALILFTAFTSTIHIVIDAKVFPYLRTMEVTAYTAGQESTGKNQSSADFGVTASTYKINVGQGEKCLAAPPEIKFGTRIYVPGYGVGIVKDRGEAIVDNSLDIYFDNIEDARKWGRKKLQILVFP